jgi:hypothetical protein
MSTSTDPALPAARFELVAVRGGWLLQLSGGARRFHHIHGAIGVALCEARGARCIVTTCIEGFLRVLYDSERDAPRHRNK